MTTTGNDDRDARIEVFDRSPVPARVQWAGCMFAVYVGTRDPVRTYADIRALDGALGKRHCRRCIEEGVYFHTDFTVSSAHSDEILEKVLERMERAATKVPTGVGVD
jgi:glutamate-1-semialdehyde 2,1-aminomutase